MTNMSDLLNISSFFVVIVCLIKAGSAEKTDYCSRDLCHFATHIACNNKGNFGTKCSTDAQIIRINATMQLTIVTKHNELRNLVATGKLTGFKSAIRMATMEWDKEMAKLATFNVKQCELKHDPCRNTETYRLSGQNLAHIKWKGLDMTVENTVKKDIQNWFDEYKLANMKDIQKFQWHDKSFLIRDDRQIGHFTAIVQEKNCRVGCAILRQTAGTFHHEFLACNYAYTNIVGQPVYRDGFTATKCTTGKNPIFPGLCSKKEQYDVNDGWSF